MLLSIFWTSGGEGGFNPIDLAAGGNLFWTLVIFFVSVPLIWKIVMGPVAKALDERDERAQSAIAAAEKASAEAEKSRQAVEAALGQAQSDAAKLLGEARTRAEARSHEILDAAKVEAGNLLESARRSIRTEQDKAISAIRNEVVDLSLRAASKVLERNVASEDDKRLVNELVASRAPVEN